MPDPTLGPRARNEIAPSAFLIGIGALLLLAGMMLHPAEEAAGDPTMQAVNEHRATWIMSHWLLSAGFATLAAAGILQAARGARPGGAVAGAFLAIGSLVLLPAEMLEATAAAEAARQGDLARFTTEYDIALATIAALPVVFLSLASILAGSPREAPVATWAIRVGAAGLAVGAIAPIGVHLAGVAALAPLIFAAVPGLLVSAWWGFRTTRAATVAAAHPRTAAG